MNEVNESLIPFRKMEWESPQKGVRQKVYLKGQKRIRLVEFNDIFIEKDWCTKAHIGYVTNGEMLIDFNGHIERYEKGDGLWIETGEEEKHKVIIGKGQRVELILFEEI